MNYLTLVIPAKHESESLPAVLDEIKNENYEIFVVLEKNDLKTIEAIKDYSCKIINQTDKGFGNALTEGIQNVKTKYFCIFNADGSFDPKDIKKMLFKIENKNLDLIFASRYEKNSGSDDDTIVTFIGNKLFSSIGKIFFSLPISDILYTFVLGNAEKINQLNLIQKDFRFCVELPIKAKRKNFGIDIIDAYERKRIAGKKKVNAIKDGFLIFCCMVSLFFNK